MKTDNKVSQSQLRNILPWWTWVAPLIIFFAASYLSSIYRISSSAALIYLPTAIGIILVNWWGPVRVLPMVYINAVICGYLWGVDPWYFRPLFALPETSFVFLSWYLFSVKNHGKYWIPDTHNLNLFLLWGIIIPLFISFLFLKVLFYLTFHFPIVMFSSTAVLGWLREFMCNFGLTLPILYFLTPVMGRHGLLAIHFDFNDYSPKIPGKDRLLVIAIYFLIFMMSFFVGLDQYWFVYGVFSLWFALRFGFGMAVLTNSFIFILAYIIPVVREIEAMGEYTIDPVLINIYLGTSLLYVFSAITGRVIDDINFAREQITDQVIRLERANSELKTTNKELDHFVYSVSHDLTAPLKSIKGLVNLSTLTQDQAEHRTYFNKIEDSVRKLEQFIVEVLDFSHVKRVEANYQRIDMQELIADIIEDVRYMDGFDAVEIDFSSLTVGEIINDKTSVRVILANLIGNAIAYRKKNGNHPAKITITSRKKGSEVSIMVSDNGEGIKPEILKRIFEMFYRGTTNSKGSGLGLYIASEAAQKIKGKITVQSEFGMGSVFTLHLRTVHK
ncbi:MAG: ATP-binding protein [Imperialibacter sp.]|uniref:ATP-binding protein n=1 Tax=Imperialibacter sp. TaxID=2038411 RepID=UPI0032EDD563